MTAAVLDSDVALTSSSSSCDDTFNMQLLISFSMHSGRVCIPVPSSTALSTSLMNACKENASKRVSFFQQWLSDSDNDNDACRNVVDTTALSSCDVHENTGIYTVCIGYDGLRIKFDNEYVTTSFVPTTWKLWVVDIVRCDVYAQTTDIVLVNGSVYTMMMSESLRSMLLHMDQFISVDNIWGKLPDVLLSEILPTINQSMLSISSVDDCLLQQECFLEDLDRRIHKLSTSASVLKTELKNQRKKILLAIRNGELQPSTCSSQFLASLGAGVQDDVATLSRILELKQNAVNHSKRMAENARTSLNGTKNSRAKSLAVSLERLDEQRGMRDKSLLELNSFIETREIINIVLRQRHNNANRSNISNNATSLSMDMLRTEPPLSPGSFSVRNAVAKGQWPISPLHHYHQYGFHGDNRSTNSLLDVVKNRPILERPSLMEALISDIDGSLSQQPQKMEDDIGMENENHLKYIKNSTSFMNTRSVRNKLFSEKVLAMHVRQSIIETRSSCLRYYGREESHDDGFCFSSRNKSESLAQEDSAHQPLSPRLSFSDNDDMESFIFSLSNAQDLAVPRCADYMLQRCHSKRLADTKDTLSSNEKYEYMPKLHDLDAVHKMVISLLTVDKKHHMVISVNKFTSYLRSTYTSATHKQYSLSRAVKDVRTFTQQLCSSLFFSYRCLVCPALQHQCRLSVELVIFASFGDILMGIYSLSLMKRECILLSKMDELRDILPCDLGISNCCYVVPGTNLPYQSAIDLFININQVKSPMEKMQCLVDTCKEISACVQRQSSNTFIGADDLLKVWAYVILKSRIPNLISQCSLCIDFVDERFALGEYGYGLVTFQSALEFLSSVTLSDLKDSL